MKKMVFFIENRYISDLIKTLITLISARFNKLIFKKILLPDHFETFT